MLNNNQVTPSHRRRLPASGIPPAFRPGHYAIAVLTLLAVLFQTACIFWGDKQAVMPSAPVRIAFLPFNTPEGNEDLRWASMAMPIMMAKIAEESTGLEPISFWETMKFTMETAGRSRILTDEDAAFVANWLNSKWATIGELTQEGKNKVGLMVDFIPPQEMSIPFRYIKKVNTDSVDLNIRKSFMQFLNYISATPFDSATDKRTSLASLRRLAEALDREYGWTVPAEPGKAEEIVSNLAQSDIQLARYLFNPAVYPVLQDK